MKKAYSIKS